MLRVSMRVEGYGERVRGLRFRFSFEERIMDVDANARTLMAGCDQVVRSPRLKKVLTYVLRFNSGPQ